MSANIQTLTCDEGFRQLQQPEKTVDIWRRHQRFPREMTYQKRAQKFHPDLGSASDWSCRVENLEKHYPGLGSEKPWVAWPNVGCFLRLQLHISYLFFFQQMYYRQKGQRTPTRPQAIHDNFDLCAEALVQRLTSYKTQSEEYHNSCIQGEQTGYLLAFSISKAQSLILRYCHQINLEVPQSLHYS